jgi:hypothetical protein
MATYGAGGARSKLNVTAATVVKPTPGTVFKVVIVTAPTAAGGIYDSASTTGLSATNLIDPIGTGVTSSQVMDLTWPCSVGITIDPGTGGVVSVSFT